MFSIKNLGLNKIKIDEKLYKKNIIYYIVNVTDKKVEVQRSSTKKYRTIDQNKRSC